jgi:selenide, water dikinase
LKGLPRQSHPQLLVGLETFDDAGVFVMSDDLALVQTVDFFAPIVDDPYLFGQIAAANALSDVYAMGGQPMTAMNIVGWPSAKLDMAILGDILRGGHDKVHEAGAVIVGGHTVIDDEVKYGLSVTGRVHPKKILTNAAATSGDQLVLTKPIGTGLLATAMKQGRLSPAAAEVLYANMTRLNAHAAEVATRIGARCATDITGFGLLGHSYHLAQASGVTLSIDRARVPLLPEAQALATSGLRTGGLERNEAYLESRITWNAASAVDKALLQDPQTSGGLLVCVPAARLADYLSAVDGAVHIGEVTDFTPGREATNGGTGRVELV